jgi:hypothetical protein
MMKKKWLSLTALAVVLPLLSVNAAAALDMTQNWTDGTNNVTVHSWVDDLSGSYRYSYQITLTSTNINYFMVELPVGAAVPINLVLSGIGANPLFWEVDSPATGVTAFFKPQLSANGSSCVLSFESTDAPVVGSATVGFSGKALTGTVFTPIPEPATFAMLGLGMMVFIKKKRA